MENTYLMQNSNLYTYTNPYSYINKLTIKKIKWMLSCGKFCLLFNVNPRRYVHKFQNCKFLNTNKNHKIKRGKPKRELIVILFKRSCVFQRYFLSRGCGEYIYFYMCTNVYVHLLYIDVLKVAFQLHVTGKQTI